MPKRPQDRTDTTRTFSTNVRTLIDYHGETPAAAARRCRIPQPQMDRFTKCQISPTLDSVHRVAAGYNIEAYQLLLPDLDPDNLPMAVARRLWQRMRDIGARARQLQEDENSLGGTPDSDIDSSDQRQSKTGGAKKSPKKATR